MSGTADPWAAFPVVGQARPLAAQADPWAAFPAVEQAPSPPAAPAQPPQAQEGIFPRSAKMLDNIVRQIANGVTFGAADEIAAGLNTATGLGQGDYSTNLAAERKRDADFQREHPYVATGATVAGAVASPVNKLFMPAAASGSLPGAMLRSGAGGAGAGATAGFLSGEGGFQNRAANAAGDAVMGFGVGAAVPAAASGFWSIYDRARSMISNAPRMERAERTILRDLARDDVAPDELLAASQRAAAQGQPAAVADLAGPNTLQTAQVLARTPGAGQRLATETLERGGANQANRLAENVREGVSGVDFRDAMEKLMVRRSTSAHPLFEESWNLPVSDVLRSQLWPILNAPIGKSAIQRGIRIMEEEGRGKWLESVRAGNPDPSTLFDIKKLGLGEKGLVTGDSSTYTLRLLHAAKLGLDDIIYNSERARNPKTGALTQFGRAIDNQRYEFVRILREAFPKYGEALDAWAGPSAAMDAMRLGRRIVSEGPEAFERSARELGKMDPGGKAFVRVGAARALLDRLEAATDPAELTRLNRMLGTPAVRERIRVLFDDEREFNQFLNTWTDELQMARTNAAIAPRGGSPTMPMQERAADLRSPPGPSGVFVDRNSGPPVGLGEEMLRAGASGGLTAPAFRMGIRGMDALRERGYRANSEAMAPYLLTTDPAKREELIRRLMVRALREQNAAQSMRPFVSPLASGLPAAAALETNNAP